MLVSDNEPDVTTLLSGAKISFLTVMLGQTKDVPGDIIEAGVYEGGSLALIREYIKDWPKQVYGYDTFEGLPAVSAFDNHRKGDFCYTDIERLSELLGDVILVKGYYPDSDSERVNKVSFAHLDMDLYEPTLHGLLHLDDFLSDGAIVVLDDYKWRDTPGIEKAVSEFLALRPNRYKLRMAPECQAALKRCYFMEEK